MLTVLLLSLLTFVDAEVYCKSERGSEVNLYSSSSSCVSPDVLIPNYFANFRGYSKVNAIVKDVSQDLYFGGSPNPFISKELEIKTEQLNNNNPFIYFLNLQNDLPLKINSEYPINRISFNLYMGNTPTRIYVNVSTLKIEPRENGNYNLPRQRTFFGTASNTTTSPHLFYKKSQTSFMYGISSFGDKFPSIKTSDFDSDSIITVSCGGMYRYYSTYGQKIISLIKTCNKTFTENDDDDFDSFIVTVKISILLTEQVSYLSSSNLIVESIIDKYQQTIFSYPNMFYKYVSLNNTNILIQGTKERLESIKISFYILSVTEPSSTSIMEVQNVDKNLSTYIIATSRLIPNINFNTFKETDTIKSQVMLIGLENQVIQITNSVCETAIKKPYFEQCYSCKEESYLINGICSNEKIECSKTFRSKCISCNKGYYVSNGICQDVTTINSNCLNSVSNSYCSECKNGFYVNQGSCELKDVNCLKYGNGVCMKCQFGYKLKNKKCERAGDLHCYYEKDQCIECSDNYTLNGNSCILKDENKNGNNEIRVKKI